MSNQSLVSIVLPVQNSGKFLYDCLQSLLMQTYHNIEIIAIDDNSKDNSFSILRALKRQDNRLKIYKNKKRYGLAVTLNRAVKRAHGAYVAFMSPQDKSSRNRIQQQLTFLAENPKVAAVGTQCVYLDTKSKRHGKSDFPIEHEMISKSLLGASIVQPETVMINKTLLPKDILKFQPLSYPLIYTDLFMKLLAYAQFANHTKALYYHRHILTTSSKTAKFILAHTKLWIKSLALPDYRPTLRSLFTPLIKQA